MKLHYMGKYNNDPESLPTKPHRPNATKFKEPEDTKKVAIIANTIASAIVIVFIAPIFILAGADAMPAFCLGAFLSLFTLLPHELLHAICFKEDVYLYTNLKQGMLFVVGPEDMSKSRFILLSLLPTIVFGVIPYVIFIFKPELLLLGSFGAFSISMGGGDFINVFNAITQMPKGAKTYLHKFNSYWYIPQQSESDNQD